MVYFEVGSILIIFRIEFSNLSQKLIGLLLEFLNLSLYGVYKTVAGLA